MSKIEKNDINKITYLILQHVYLEKKGIDTSDIKNISEIFPQGWSSLNYENKIKIMSYALKNDCSLEKSLDKNRDQQLNNQK